MSISTISSNISKIMKEIADIRKKISDESKKEVDLSQRVLQIQNSITKSTHSSLLKSKLSEIQRKQDSIARVQKTKADLAKQEADKTKKLLAYNQQLSKEDDRERKKIDAAIKRQNQEQINFQKKLNQEIAETARRRDNSQNFVNKNNQSEYDIFISHASEDKEDFVRPLAEALMQAGIRVWYDELTLKVGDSLRKSIDYGLAKSRYGTVVLSSSFFAKNWTQYELDGMVTKEMNGHKMILPIWHKVSKTEVINFSPTLADKVALNSSLNSIEEITKQLVEVIKS